MSSVAATFVEIATKLSVMFEPTMLEPFMLFELPFMPFKMRATVIVGASIEPRPAVIPASVVAAPVEARPPVVPVIPRAGADEHATDEPVWTVVAVRRTSIRVIIIVAIGAYRHRPNVSRAYTHANDHSLCMRE